MYLVQFGPTFTTVTSDPRQPFREFSFFPFHELRRDLEFQCPLRANPAFSLNKVCFKYVGENHEFPSDPSNAPPAAFCWNAPGSQYKQFGSGSDSELNG